jgi:hypothetical protein
MVVAMKIRKPGTVREGRIPIYDHRGVMKGNVGPHATSVTVSRFLGRSGATLGRKDGRRAWIGPSAPKPHRFETKNHASARGSVKAK